MTKGEVVLILGGARSGKSDLAQKLAAEGRRRVLYVATATAGDAEMEYRIARHRKERPPHWLLVEVRRNVAERLSERISTGDVLILDCLTLLVANILLSSNLDPAQPGQTEQQVWGEIEGELQELLCLVRQWDLQCLVVSNEVGSGIVPAHYPSRLYRDLLGRANQYVAQRADRVYLMVAGIPLLIKG